MGLFDRFKPVHPRPHALRREDALDGQGVKPSTPRPTPEELAREERTYVITRDGRRVPYQIGGRSR